MANSSSSVRGLKLEGEEDLMPDQRVQGEGRTPLAQRRAVQPPSTINTAPASASATAATPAAGSAASPRLPSTVPSTPSMTMRRRTSLVAESDSPAATAGHPLSPRTPHLPYYPPHSPNPTDAGLHLQQARASVVQVATRVQDGGRKRSFVDGGSGGGLNGAGAAGTIGGFGGGAKRQSSHPPPAPSSTFRLGSILSSSSHPSNGLPPVVASPPVSSDDHLMNLTPSDLRRPSFLATAVSTAKSLSSSSSSSSAPSPRRFLLFFPSRRMQKTLRLWALAALALLAFIKLVDFFLLPSTSTTMLRNLRTSSTPSPSDHHLLHTPSPPSDQLPDSFADWVARGQAPLPPSYAQQPPLAASPAAEVRKPFQVQLGNADPDEGLLVEAEQSRLPFEKAWDERMARLSPSEQEERKKRELVLSPVELADMRRNRRERLWGPPEEDLWVEVAKPAKGHLHESTIIFLHGLGERAVDSFMPIHLHKQFPNTRWVLPQAPKRPVTALSASHPAWFDIDSFPYNPYTDRDPDGLFASVRALNRVIAEERALLIRNLRRRGGGVSPGPRGGEGYATGVGPDGAGEGEEGEEFGTPAEREWASQRVVVAGFSQGSVVALLSALTFPERLGGVAVFSGFLPIREDLSKLIVDLDRKDLPVFWGHGQDDPYLLFTDALTSISLLSPSSVPTFPHSPLAIPSSLASDHPSYILNLTSVTFESYVGLGHTWAWPELQDVARFLEGVLPRGVQRGEKLPRNLGAVPAVEQQEMPVVPPPPALPSPPPLPPVPPVGGEGRGMRRMRR